MTIAVERIPFIAGNWKMHCDHLQAIALVQKIAWSLGDARHDFRAVEVGVFPPFTDLRSVQTLVSADKLLLSYGAQDVSESDSGAYTGEISAAFLRALGCRYVIIGHSERRSRHGETDELIAAKVATTVRHELVPIICVGESADDRDAHGPSTTAVAQLQAALAHVSPDSEFVVAYEPVWAIGSGVAATPEQAEEVAAALRHAVATRLGDDRAAMTRVLYGGSVKAANIAGFMKQPNIDGALVGGASLDATEFSAIARFRDHVGVG